MNKSSQIIKNAYSEFGNNLVMTTSFGAHSALMLHLATQINPKIQVIFIDTGYLFPETYRFAEELEKRFSLNLRVFSSPLTSARQEALYGKLWEQGEEGVSKYLKINKVEPLKRALKETKASAWISGIRAEQTEHRSKMNHCAKQGNITKIHPILHFTINDVEQYFKKHNLPFHPLYKQGYLSIGDVHSTFPVKEGENPRNGRMLGEKRECGIHLSFK